MDYRLNRICSVGIEHFTDLKISLVSGTAAAMAAAKNNETFDSQNASKAVIDHKSKVNEVIGSV